MSDSKQCKGCQQCLAADRFQRRSSAKDGLNSKCKGCMAADAKKRREANAEKHANGPSVDAKKCCRCRFKKAASQFSSQPTSNDGLADYCNACRRQGDAKEPKRPAEPRRRVNVNNEPRKNREPHKRNGSVFARFESSSEQFFRELNRGS